MIRRFPWRTLFLAALFLVPAGCEPHHSWLRSKDDDDKLANAAGNPTEDDIKSRKVIGAGSDNTNPTSFFQNNRTSGGWSSEAREIESHLGAN